MTTQRRPRPLRRLLLTFSIAAVGLAACGGAAAPAASSPASSGPSTSPVTSTAPSPSFDPGAGGGGSDGNAGSGGGVIVDPTPVNPAAGEPTIVMPRAGQKNPHPVGATTLQASVDGRHVLVKVTWYSGVEPCNVLDSVKVARSGTDITITLIEGSADLDAMCIELAVLKATIVDLGDLEPGTYRIRASEGEAQPIEITIS